jgi:protease II
VKRPDQPLAFPTTRGAPDSGYTRHGRRFDDPFAWLERLDDAETQAWIAAQEAVTHSVLRAVPGRDWLRSAVTRSARHARLSPPIAAGPPGCELLWQADAGDEKLKLMPRRGRGAPLETVLDPGTWGSDEVLVFAVPSPDGARVAFGKAIGGTHGAVIHVLDVATGHLLPDRPRGRSHETPAWRRRARRIRVRDGPGLVRVARRYAGVDVHRPPQGPAARRTPAGAPQRLRRLQHPGGAALHAAPRRLAEAGRGARLRQRAGRRRVRPRMARGRAQDAAAERLRRLHRRGALARHRRLHDARQARLACNSNGGLLVAVAAMQAPEAFGAVFCRVPTLDMLGPARSGSSGGAVEYGSPDDPVEGGYLAGYSPYHFR